MGQELSTGLAECCVSDSATKETKEERKSEGKKKKTQKKKKRKSGKFDEEDHQAAAGLQKLFRGHKARAEVRAKAREEPRPFYVKVHRAEDLLLSDGALFSAMDVCAVATCLTNPGPGGRPAGNAQVAAARTATVRAETGEEGGGGGGGGGGGRAVFDEELLLAPRTGDVRLLVTLVAKNKVTRDECLGQIIINLYKDGEFKLSTENITCPLVSLGLPLRGEDGAAELPLRRDRQPRGTVRLSLRAVPRLRARAGAVLRLQPTGLLGKPGWQEQWLVLAESVVVLAGPNAPEPLLRAPLDRVVEIKDIVYRESIHEEGLRAIRLRLQDAPDEYLRCADAEGQGAWLQALRRAAIQAQYGVEVY